MREGREDEETQKDMRGAGQVEEKRRRRTTVNSINQRIVLNILDLLFYM